MPWWTIWLAVLEGRAVLFAFRVARMVDQTLAYRLQMWYLERVVQQTIRGLARFRGVAAGERPLSLRKYRRKLESIMTSFDEEEEG